MVKESWSKQLLINEETKPSKVIKTLKSEFLTQQEDKIKEINSQNIKLQQIFNQKKY